MPSGLLGYLALRGVRNDQALFERELRERLEGEAAMVVSSFSERMTSIWSLADDPARLVREEPLVDAVFSVTPEGQFGHLVSSASLFGVDDGLWTSVAAPAGTDADLLEVARRLELRDEDFAAAASEYVAALSAGSSDQARAEALSGLARVSRKLGRIESAADHYRRLVSEFGSVRSGAGVPFALAGRLELIALLDGTESPEAIATEVSALIEALLGGEQDLTGTEYRFVADRARSVAAGLVAGSPGLSERWGDSLSILLAREEVERRRTARVRAFVRAATDDPSLLAELTRPGRTDGSRSQVIPGDGGPFPVHIVMDRVRGLDRIGTDVGLLIDPLALELLVTDVVREASSAGAFDWILRDEAGSIVDASGGAVDPGVSAVAPPVVTSFPGRVPPLTLGLLPPTASAVESFFSSPQSLYLYAFVLVAGILAGGLALTVRTLTHQLELARMQSDFVSTVSHELKSPLTAIRQLAEMLQAGRVPSEARRRRYFDVLVEQSERLTALIDHVLDFARIDGGHAELDFTATDLGPLLEEVVGGVQDRVRHQGFVIDTSIDAGLPRVILDQEAIALAVTNIIDNAIKFSGDAREVIVRASAENGHALIAVRDFGLGLDPSERERVFERFYRGGEALAQAVTGTGLGLTLVKQIVEAHGGVVNVDSEPGCGSTFTLRLPVSGP